MCVLNTNNYAWIRYDCVKLHLNDLDTLYLFRYSVSPQDYDGVRGETLQFNQGDERITHNITINQDDECEDDPNEFFFSNLALVSGVQPIAVIQPRAQITIIDDVEPECSK